MHGHPRVDAVVCERSHASAQPKTAITGSVERRGRGRARRGCRPATIAGHSPKRRSSVKPRPRKVSSSTNGDPRADHERVRRRRPRRGSAPSWSASAPARCPGARWPSRRPRRRRSRSRRRRPGRPRAGSSRAGAARAATREKPAIDEHEREHDPVLDQTADRGRPLVEHVRVGLAREVARVAYASAISKRDEPEPPREARAVAPTILRRRGRNASSLRPRLTAPSTRCAPSPSAWSPSARACASSSRHRARSSPRSAATAAATRPAT